MSDSDTFHRASSPPTKDRAAESDALTGSDANEGKPSRSQSRRARRRRQHERKKGNMPAVGEERQDEGSKGSVQPVKRNADRRLGTGANPKEAEVGKQSTAGDTKEGDGDITKKEGLKLRLELDLNVELELKAKIRGSVTLALL